MNRFLGLLGLAAAGWFPGLSAASVPEAGIAPPPEWVEPVESVRALPKNDVHPVDGEYYLVVDEQIRAATPSERFYHYAIALTTQAAVEGNSQISVAFDPSYEKLTLHSVRLWRNGEAIEQLNPGKVQMLQRERQMEELIYDGRWTASIILDDVRPGDIIDYSYSLAGDNPAYAGHFAARIDLQWAVPVLHTSFRLLWPNQRPLSVTPYNTNLRAEKTTRGAMDEYRIERRDIPALRVESEAPSWYIPWPRITFSDLSTWEQVAQWALSHYETSRPPGPEISAIAEQIRASNDTAERQAAAALHFVQREVRYFGRENGMGSHVPAPAELTLQRRYGDCKAKSLLLLSLMDALGIQGHAALVNTRYGKVLDHDGPRISAFDHVIVQAKMGGTVYWLDPTRSDQKGELDAISQPDYGNALVLRKGSRELAPMKPLENISRRSVDEVIDLRSGVGEKKKALFRIRTTYTGSEAEGFRNRLSADGRKILENEYLNYYARKYSDIEQEKPIRVEDEHSLNRIDLYESYLIPNIWSKDEDAMKWQADFYSDALYWLLAKPEERRRSAPFEVAFPADVTQTITVLLPQAWRIENDETSIENPYFSFKQKTQYYPKEKKLVLWYRFRSLTDSVPGEEIDAYLAAVDDVWDALDYKITSSYGKEKADSSAGPETEVGLGRVTTGALVLLLLLGGIFAFSGSSWGGAARSFRFVLLSMALFNVHEFYWFYRNWAHVRKHGYVYIMRF